MTSTTVNPPPLVDLGWQHRPLAAELAERFAEIFERGDFVLGRAVEQFERAFAEFSRARHCIGVANGTDALELVLRGLHIGPGDEVIVPANSFFATAEAVLLTGATAVLVDVDPDHHLLDIEAAAAAVTSRTRAVLPVHLYGQMAFVERLRRAIPQGVAVVEDAAQSQGATRHGWSIGAMSDAAATSFYPGKNLGAAGDAGGVLTDDDELAAAVRRLRNHGSDEKYRHTEIGRNSRLDSLQAVVLSAKLSRLAAWNALRREAADRYRELLAGTGLLRGDAREDGSSGGIKIVRAAEGNEHVFHLYVVEVERRDDVLRHLQAQGIGVGVHYPIPLHRQPALAGRAPTRGPLEVTEAAATRILSLPLYPGIEPGQQELVVHELARAVSRAGR